MLALGRAVVVGATLALEDGDEVAANRLLTHAAASFV